MYPIQSDEDSLKRDYIRQMRFNSVKLVDVCDARALFNDTWPDTLKYVPPRILEFLDTGVDHDVIISSELDGISKRKTLFRQCSGAGLNHGKAAPGIDFEIDKWRIIRKQRFIGWHRRKAENMLMTC